MKKRIFFRKLIDRRYDLNTELQVISWFLNTGKSYAKYTGRWTKCGEKNKTYPLRVPAILIYCMAVLKNFI